MGTKASDFEKLAENLLRHVYSKLQNYPAGNLEILKNKYREILKAPWKTMEEESEHDSNIVYDTHKVGIIDTREKLLAQLVIIIIFLFF